MSEGPLELERAKKLDAIFADPCFAAEPDRLAWKVAKKQPCTGFGHWVRIRTGDRERYVSDSCNLGYGVALPQLVTYADIGLGTYVERAAAARLSRSDLQLSDVKLGRQQYRQVAVCGKVAASGLDPTRFTYRRWYPGPFAKEAVIVPGDRDDYDREFDAHWAYYCEGADKPTGG